MKPLSEAHFAILRRHMVEVVEIEYDLMAQEIGQSAPSPAVRAAVLDTPRHLFVPAQLASLAYENRPLPIGFSKTISQPFLSALMLDLLELEPGQAVLEVGTGLGFQTALLSQLGARVWSIDVVEEFVTFATAQLKALERAHVTLRIGDGSRGWPEAGPFDAILVSAAAKELPHHLAGQLAVGGRMVLPLGPPGSQRLVQIRREDAAEVSVREIMPVAFTELETV
jgi:protein-L-isoaspartate(D-aspartate) O-methyltransferase